MESTTLTDLSQSDFSHLAPQKTKSKEKFLWRLTNKLKNFFHHMWYPLGNDELRYAMKKVGMKYCENFSNVDVPIELQAHYILLIEVIFKEKILAFSKEQFLKDYAPTWNVKLLELHYSCTESDLIKISFLATHSLVLIKGLFLEVFGVTAKNLRVIFAKNSPHIDLCSFAAKYWKTNPLLSRDRKTCIL